MHLPKLTMSGIASFTTNTKEKNGGKLKKILPSVFQLFLFTMGANLVGSIHHNLKVTQTSKTELFKSALCAHALLGQKMCISAGLLNQLIELFDLLHDKLMGAAINCTSVKPDTTTASRFAAVVTKISSCGIMFLSWHDPPDMHVQ